MTDNPGYQQHRTIELGAPDEERGLKVYVIRCSCGWVDTGNNPFEVIDLFAVHVATVDPPQPRRDPFFPGVRP